ISRSLTLSLALSAVGSFSLRSRLLTFVLSGAGAGSCAKTLEAPPARRSPSATAPDAHVDLRDISYPAGEWSNRDTDAPRLTVGAHRGPRRACADRMGKQQHSSPHSGSV